MTMIIIVLSVVGLFVIFCTACYNMGRNDGYRDAMLQRWLDHHDISVPEYWDQITVSIPVEDSEESQKLQIL